MKKFIIATLTLASFGGLAHADESGFGARGSILWGAGPFANSSSSIPSRTMDSLSIEALPGYTTSGFLFGLLGEYRFVGQLTDPAKVTNQNLKGHTWLVGVGVSYRALENVDIMAGVEFLGKHSLSKADPMGNRDAYQSPLGLLLQGGYRFLRSWSGDFRIAMTRYSTDNVGGTSVDVSSDRRKTWDFALGATYHY